MKRFRKNQKGFTLIEALIVVIIVAILAALGIARFLGVREATAQSTCYSHLSTLNASMKKFDLEHPGAPFDGSQDADVLADAGNPYCPSGGAYSSVQIGTSTEYQFECDVHGTLPTAAGT